MAINALSGAQPMPPTQPGMASPMGAPQTQNLQIGQMPMNGVTPIYHMPGQMGGGGPDNGFGQQNDGMGRFAPFMNALQGWLQQRPHFQGFDGNRQDFHTQMMDWRQQRPSFSGMGFGGFGNVGMVPGVPGSMGLNPGGQMTPGGGGTGAPLQGTAAPQMAPQSPANPYQFPSY